MVFRLVGLVGLTLLPAVATATEPAVHEALGSWLADDGVGETEYTPVGAMFAPTDRPGWLLRPGGADAVSRFFLERSLYPEAVSLDWREGLGAVLIFGARQPGGGFRLVVDRDRQRPVELETADGVRWRFLDYRSRAGRRTGLPARIVRLGPDGGRYVFTPER
jgi:hypothetical protein